MRAALRFNKGTSRDVVAKSHYSLDNFEMNSKAIGKGACGYVRLAYHVGDKGWYAIKCISKQKLAKHKHGFKHIMNERRYLQMCSSPFVLQCYGSFQDKTFLYLVLSFVEGGELHRLLYHGGRFSEDKAMYYAAELLCGLRYIHSMGLAYRDMKPENVLIDRSGHVVIADFGYVKELEDDGRCYTKVGTPHYLAPEILDMHSNSGYTQAVDWWSWGCVLYEMMRGRPAFGTAMDSSYAVYIRVMKCKYKMPPHFHPPRGTL